MVIIIKKSLVTLSVIAGFLGLGSLAASADTYTVQSGDTVANIAASHNDTVNGIASRNKLSNVNLIFVGQQLEVGQNTASANTQVAATTTPAVTTQTQSTPVASTTTNNTSASYNTNTNTASANTSSSSNYGTGSHAAVLSQMESRTGVSASTWNYIINRESNWQSSVRNSTSGAYGLFQNMHISGGSVQDQIDAAVSLYNQQGMAAWSM